MEQKEATAIDKASHLVSKFEKSFLHIRSTFHPSDIPGEIAGKSSNVACAARSIIEIHRPELKMDCCNVVVTVMDGKSAHNSIGGYNPNPTISSGHSPLARLLYRNPASTLLTHHRG